MKDLGLRMVLGTLDKLALWRLGHELDGRLVQNSAGVTSDAVVPLGGFP